MTDLAVVVPARNEVGHLPSVIAGIPRYLPGVGSVRVIVVDDGSEDGTGAAARAGGALVVRHRVNLGKGAALLTGCDVAVRRGAGMIVVMDGDGQHRAADIRRLVGPLVDGFADLVVAYRNFGGAMPAAMRLGNWGLSAAFGVLYGHRFRDTQCGFRAFTGEAYAKIRWESAAYAVETEMLVRAARAGQRVIEVPIEAVYHDRYKGTTPADGVRIFASMLRWVIGGG